MSSERSLFTSQQQSAITLCLIMGLPGAGKSSLARGIQSSFRGTAAVVIVELDDFLTHRAQPAARTCEAGELIFDPDEWH